MPAVVACAVCGVIPDEKDNFCPSCGTKILRGQDQPSGPVPSVKPDPPKPSACPDCGTSNPPESIFCEECGVRLRSGRAGAESTDQQPRRKAAASQATTAGQVWKPVAAFAALLLVALIVFVSSGQKPEEPAATEAADPHDSHMIAEIQELQASVDANPEDTTSVLRLANLYFDVRFFQRAVPLYERYLLANPANPDARVDLGTSHFELSVSDSAGQEEHLRVAEESFLKALEYAPKHPLAHFNLGIINLRQGRVEEARKWLEKCAELAPDSEAGRRARQLVDQHITS